MSHGLHRRPSLVQRTLNGLLHDTEGLDKKGTVDALVTDGEISFGNPPAMLNEGRYGDVRVGDVPGGNFAQPDAYLAAAAMEAGQVVPVTSIEPETDAQFPQGYSAGDDTSGAYAPVQPHWVAPPEPSTQQLDGGQQ